MVTGTSTQEEEPQPGLWMNQFSVPTRNYHAKTNVFWEYKQELVNRRKFRIEQEYDLLKNNSANVSESADFARHIFVLSMIRTRMKMFNEHFKHREIRRTMFSARQSTKHQIVNQGMKLLPIQVTTKRQRKRWHANRRAFAREQGWEQNDLPTIAFYGAGDMPLIPGFAPIPHVELILLLSKFALVILTNEHNTSQVHSSCDTRLQRVQGTYIHCPHIIKRRRALTLAGNRGRKVKWCVDEAGVFLHPQADCEQGQARSKNLVHKAMQERACSRASSFYRQRQERGVQYETHWDSIHAYGWSPQLPPKCSCTATP
ncbi:hypothetical protein BJV82DRAFT_409694 [Fennellomyces sp. T-0311]|nr:hypothetical protein BJV82DRAFT_409694 [Fennellomyces sp. T-0311]